MKIAMVLAALGAGSVVVWAQQGAASAPMKAEVGDASIVRTRPVLTQSGARAALDAALARIKELNSSGAVAVVDEAGTLVAFERIEGTFPAASHVAIGKARTAALFRKNTRAFEDSINKGRYAMTAMQDFTPLQGGVLLEVDGHVVGAVGLSGTASAQQDEEIATSASSAFAQRR